MFISQILPQPNLLLTITVEAGDYDRIDTPVCVRTNDIEFDFEKEPFVIVEVKWAEKTEIPVQYEAGTDGKLWFVLSGKTESGTKRTFELYAGSSRLILNHIRAEKDEKALNFETRR